MLADRLLVIEDGRVVQEGRPAEVARRPATDYVARLVGLNLYAGRVDGDQVTLPRGGGFAVPDHGEHGPGAGRRTPVVGAGEQPPPRRGERAGTAGPGAWSACRCSPTGCALDIEASPPVLVDVTPASVAELGLAPGSEVWLSVKATDLDVYGRSEPYSPTV